MAFACQRNSYLKELVARVVSCVKVKDGYEVVLNDTVLFPEGGGQPDDRGKIGDEAVKRVFRRGQDAVHVTSEEVTEGAEYNCVVDWKRRFDHMQQHSAQHLFSALAENKYGFRTVSWELGRNISHVELNAKTVTKEQLVSMETECNEIIRNHNSVITHYLTKADAVELPEVKTRGLPDDVIEPIRVIEITGVEKNMCCGTHISNLSELQVIKLLHTETMRGGTRVFFIAGNRVINKLDQSYDMERKLTKLLSCGIDEHADSVEKLKNNLRVSLKSSRGYLKEIAKFEAEELGKISKDQGYIFKHREDGDMDYILTILKFLPDHCKHLITFVCGGPVKSGGQFILRGPEEKVNQLSESVMKLIDGKGGGKKCQLQGKTTTFKNLKSVQELIENCVKAEE